MEVPTSEPSVETEGSALGSPIDSGNAERRHKSGGKGVLWHNEARISADNGDVIGQVKLANPPHLRNELTQATQDVSCRGVTTRCERADSDRLRSVAPDRALTPDPSRPAESMR